MSKLHIKKNDTVFVNAGEDKGKTGKVLKVLEAQRQESSGWYHQAGGAYPHFKPQPR